MTSRRIVLDANILIRAVLGVRVRELIEQYNEDVSYFVPESAVVEAARHLPAIATKRGADPAPWLEALGRLTRVVEIVPTEAIESLQSMALTRIGSRDPMDWPIAAAALLLACPIWTEDRDFFGSGIPTWVTDTVEVYLSGA